MTEESKDNKHTEQRDKRQHPLPPHKMIGSTKQPRRKCRNLAEEFTAKTHFLWSTT